MKWKFWVSKKEHNELKEKYLAMHDHLDVIKAKLKASELRELRLHEDNVKYEEVIKETPEMEAYYKEQYELEHKHKMECLGIISGQHGALTSAYEARVVMKATIKELRKQVKGKVKKWHTGQMILSMNPSRMRIA